MRSSGTERAMFQVVVMSGRFIYKFSKMKLILFMIGDRWGLHVSEDAVSPLVESMVGLNKS